MTTVSTSKNTNANSGQSSINPQSCQHMTHMIFPSTQGDQYGKNGIQFQLANSMIWQIKFILSNKKTLQNASNEFQTLAEGFGKDFDKYLLRELIEQVEIKDANRTVKEKPEAEKVQLLNQELQRTSQNPEFLSYFHEILLTIYGQEYVRTKPGEFIKEISKRLKLNPQTQILISLSLLESSLDEQAYSEALNLYKQKLNHFHQNGKPEQLPEYASHRILYLFDQIPELKNDPQMREPKQFFTQALSGKFSLNIPLRGMLHQDSTQLNCHPDQLSFNLLRDGSGLEFLDTLEDFIKPWEILLDLGHSSSQSYDFLVKSLQDFRNMSEKTMALTLLHLSVNNQGKSDFVSKIVQSTLESNIDGTPMNLKKDPDEKKAIIGWNIDNLAKAFRDLNPQMNWSKIFDCFGEIEEHEIPDTLQHQGMDLKMFQTFITLYCKCKQSQAFPLQQLLNQDWVSPNLQIELISNAVIHYQSKKDKLVLFSKLKNKAPQIHELQDFKERNESNEALDVWMSIDLVERLIVISEKPNMFMKARRILEHPLKQLPEYLLLTISLAQPNAGNVLIDELLSVLLPLFLGNHSNSSLILQKLFDNNQNLFIRGICELCKHDQKLINLSRVLDITQEVKDSLLAIVNCGDYKFAVSLGILAGKRDFLHYDQWIQNRIKEIGSPFIEAVISYIQDNIVTPVIDFIKKNQQMAETNPENFETQKNTILQRSHLSKEKLALTFGNLQNLDPRSNDKIHKDTPQKIQEVVVNCKEIFPQQPYEASQLSQEVENKANELFQTVFQVAQDSELDLRIADLIVTMENLRSSGEFKDQQLYACMLHGLLEEYKFLHKYPEEFLTKYAKLFASILRTNMLNRNSLQEIAIKFVIEAFRRGGKRQKFGIIVIRSFLDILPQFPQFFEDIYQNRMSIENSDPQMMQDIERLYHQVQTQNQAQSNQSTQETSMPEQEANNEAPQDNPIDSNNQNNGSPIQEEQKMDSNGDMKEDTNQGKEKKALAKQQNQNPNQKNKNQNKKQANQNQLNQQQASQTKNLNSNLSSVREFIPNNRVAIPNQIPQQRQLSQNNQVKAFIPSNQKAAQPVQGFQPSQLVDHMNSNAFSQGPGQFKINQQIKQKQQFQQQQQSNMNPSGTGLNIKSAEFQRPGQTQLEKQINVNSKAFTPSRQVVEQIQQQLGSQGAISQRQIQELVEFQKQINIKVHKAIEAGSKLRLTDILDDSSIKIDDEQVEDQIRLICNQTDKGNFKQKIQDLKKIIMIQEPEDESNTNSQNQGTNSEGPKFKWASLRWFIHIILTRRLGQQSTTLLPIYVEMIRELNNALSNGSISKNVIGLTLYQSALIFKKCMVVNEEELSKVMNVAQGAGSVIKSYLASLGSFVGTVTLSKNEPIRNTYMDLKQILVEGFPTKNRKLAVVFVCRILKESHKSQVFTLKNPWMRQHLQTLKEISDISQQQAQSTNVNHNDCIMEIESLFKLLNVQSLQEPKPYMLIQSSQNPTQLVDPFTLKELDYLNKKFKMILPLNQQSQNQRDEQRNMMLNSVQQLPHLGQSMPQFINQSLESQANGNQVYTKSDSFKQSISQIEQKVQISENLVKILRKYPRFNEPALRNIVGYAVDNSIVEILPAVIDRAVTIARKTTAELVLKDFAYDSDYNRVLRAADLIVQNLAGSLGLVTCRGPFRINLTKNLGLIFEQYLIKDLGLEIVKTMGDMEEGQQFLNEGDNEQSQFKISLNQYNKLVEIACSENLDLCCKLTKKEVLEKARRKIREDTAITAAVESRKQAQKQGIRPYRDAKIASQLAELPPQLQPNYDGLSDAQFQVYEDFAILCLSDDESDNMALNSNLDLPTILKNIDQYGLSEQNKQQLLEKIKTLNQSTDQQNAQQLEDDKEKLWTYAQRNLETAYKNFDSRNPQQVEEIIQVLNLIVNNYKLENFSKELLKKVLNFLDFRNWNQFDLNIILMSKKIISIAEWDKQMSVLLKKQAAKLPEAELQFLSNFLGTSIIEKKLFTKEDFPQLIQVIEYMQQDKKIGQFCKNLMDVLNQKQIFRHSGEEANLQSLKDFFIKWVIISYMDDQENQKRQINQFFNDLSTLNFEKDPKTLHQFCKIMVHTSIERTLIYGDGSGELRPADRLDFRYIDSFVKLIVILLKMNNFNKHEFMTKLLEFVGEELEEDHKQKKAGFNQRPYYRIMINILVAVNHADHFNLNTKRQILFSMADLFKQLNPSAYPAFSFAWLELISHKQFLPHFMKNVDASKQQNQQQITGGLMGMPNQYLMQNLHQNQPGMLQLNGDQAFFEKRCKYKELVVSTFIFLKNNMIPGERVPPAIQAFYHATLRVITVLRHDYPEFLSDFHFHFVNSLPDHCIQLKNLILSACPSNIQEPDPFKEDLKIDLLQEIDQIPRIFSNYDNYLSLMNLKQDLENYAYARTRNPQLLMEICKKMEQSEEIVNGRRRINSNVISAVVLFLAHQSAHLAQMNERPLRDTFKQIVQALNDETRLCFLNAIVNELRYPSKHTFYFSCTILFIYSESGSDKVCEEISQIILERLQATGPHPWGLMISFREFIQNPKLEFMEKKYIKDHWDAIDKLFEGRLKKFIDFMPSSVYQKKQMMNQQPKN